MIKMTGWMGDERWKDVAQTFAKEARLALTRGAWGREQDWDAFLAAIKSARDQGAPWEALQVPRVEAEMDHANQKQRITGLHWQMDQAHMLPGYEWPLELAFRESAKTARALIELGAPLQTLLAGYQRTPTDSNSLMALLSGQTVIESVFGAPSSARMWGFAKPGDRSRSEPTPVRDPLLRADWTFEPWNPKTVFVECLQLVRRGEFFLPKYRVSKKVNYSLLSATLKALSEQVEPGERVGLAKQVLDAFRSEKESLWLNKEGCAPGEAPAAKMALWAQDTAASIAPLAEVDAQWATDAAKVKTKAKSGGSGRAAKKARESEKLPEEQTQRWPVIALALNRDDLPVWLALESLAGLDHAAGLNQPMDKTTRVNNYVPHKLFFSHAMQQGALKIATRMLDQGSNPWLLPAEVFEANSPHRKSPVAALGEILGKHLEKQNAQTNPVLAALGQSFVAALLRDAQLLEPSEEDARAMVRQELNERLSCTVLPEAVSSAIEHWSLSVELGLDGAAVGKEAVSSAAARAKSGRTKRRL